MGVINDTLKRNGKWSRKSLSALGSFSLAIVYEFVLPFFEIATKEYVFVTLIGYSGMVLGFTVWDKRKSVSNE